MKFLQQPVSYSHGCLSSHLFTCEHLLLGIRSLTPVYKSHKIGYVHVVVWLVHGKKPAVSIFVLIGVFVIIGVAVEVVGK